MKKFLLLFLTVFISSGLVMAQDLFFSEYVEGSSNNKAFEIYNGTGAAVDLSNYTVKQSHNGLGWDNDPAVGAYTLDLTGTLADGEVLVIYANTAGPEIHEYGDLAFDYDTTSTGTAGPDSSRIPFFNGDDAMGLFKNGTLIDVIGVPDVDPGSAWDVAGVTGGTVNHTLVRKSTVTQGNTDWANSAGTNADDSQWIVYDQDTFNHLGLHPGYRVNVTFRVNSSTVLGLTDSNSVVDLRGTVTQWGPGTDMTNVGGDYWEITVQLLANNTFAYKYGARDTTVAGVSQWWENEIPGANYQGGDRPLTTGTEDMILDLDYLGRGPNNNNPPYTPTDSVDIYIKVNMAGKPVFNPDTEAPSLVGHFPAPGGAAADMWNPNAYKFTRIGDTDYWQYHLRLAQSYIDTVENIKFDGNWPESARGMHMYRFAVTDWGNSEDLQGKYWPGNENRVLFLKNTTKDTTLVWKYWNDTPPADVEIVTAVITWRVSTEALEAMGLFNRGIGDKIEVLGPKSWTPGDGLEMIYQPILKAWVTNNEEFTQVVGAQLQYKYYVLWDPSRIDPQSPNYIPHLDIANHGWEEPATTGGTDRFHTITSATEQQVVPDLDTDRQFFNGIPANSVIDHPVTVTFNIDMTKATSADDNTIGDLFRPGVDTVWIRWSGELNAVTQGYTRDSILIKLQDPDADMVYTGSYTMTPSTKFPHFSYQFGFTAVYSSDNGLVQQGGGTNLGRRYYQYIKPLSVADGDPWPITTWPTEYTFPTLEWVASDLPVEVPPDLQTPTAIGTDDGKLPIKFTLEQNYPNPFNPTTAIRYQVAKTSDVLIRVYNIMGQEVTTLVNQNQNPGRYQIVWNGKNNFGREVASGIYYFKMEAGKFESVKKMTLIR